ncbi:MAG: aspartate--ammonia ligase [Clostridia bacterium]|nr:aspartate--ammonia ligase [Clostridia bacterium]
MYTPKLNLQETELAIKALKDHFESTLAAKLNLTRVSAPLFVLPETGLNDNLSGTERPVAFDVKETGKTAEIVHSLAKWKRHALKRYGFEPGEGLYTDMNAIRRDEICDNLHSIYVDQYDWEKIITPSQRNVEYLKRTVCDIYEVIHNAQRYLEKLFPVLKCDSLPPEITFVTAQELEDQYPDLTAKQREHEAAVKYGAVFIMGIGGKLRSGKPHDGRAPDYDDWSLNGDIILYYKPLDIALEVSSMGIRVDAEAMNRQLHLSNLPERACLPYHSGVLSGELPLTIGGGIGQSRLCMFFLQKMHIGEVQSSIWPIEMQRDCEEKGIILL